MTLNHPITENSQLVDVTGTFWRCQRSCWRFVLLASRWCVLASV